MSHWIPLSQRMKRFSPSFTGVGQIRLWTIFAIRVSARRLLGTSFVQTHTLPPTSSNAKFHSLRVYYQVQEWLGVPPADVTQYGWQHGSQGQLLPVISSTPAAPPELLKIIRCTCLGNCETNRCSCREHGLECSPWCSECCGISCSNSLASSID